MKKSILCSAVLFLSMAVMGNAHAAAPGEAVRAGRVADDLKLKVQFLGEQKLVAPKAPVVPFVAEDFGDDVGEANVILDNIINMGKKVWDVVAANKPVVNVAYDKGDAVPEGVKSWMSLGGWQAPTARLYRVQYENLYGIDVIDFTYRVIYTAGGNYDGKGQYLTNVTIVPANLDVSWGYTFNAQATVPGVTNAGSTNDPVAGMQLQLKWSVDTILKHNESTAAFYVRGDGAFEDLSGN